jgi:glyoxylase-like metal-dependent hydrolase (beta-lactamase superfamily II)
MTPSTSDLPLVRTRQLGNLRIHAIEAGLQWLDGGAMFGVVPRPLWQKRIAPDERHRIPLALRCLLIEAPEALVLVDTGIGNKENDKFKSIYGVANEGSPTRLEDGIRAAGFTPDDLDLVVLTHLHFDHAGGNTMRRDDDRIVPAFPNATYVINEHEFEFAHRNNPRIRASYLPANYDPVAEAGLVRFVRSGETVTRGVELLGTPGHTPHHMSVVVDGEGEKACFLADVCPTAAHVPLPWIMGYDLEPLVTLDSKQGLWQQAREEDWLLIFEHDAEVPWGRLDPGHDQLVAEPGDTTS